MLFLMGITMIPKIIHFIFGLDSEFCNKPFSYFHYLNIKSANIVNPTYKLKVYFKHKPSTVWFDKLSEFCELVEIAEIESFNNQSIVYKEHISDYLRLNILSNFGGVYIDTDTICISPFDDLLNNMCVLGMECGSHDINNPLEMIGLCNAAILSIPNSEFIRIWIENYTTNYQASDWNYNSVRLPYQLSQKYPSLITILPQNAFFKYSWGHHGKRYIFDSNSNISECYSLHLWESHFFDILSSYTPQIIERTDNTICNLYKRLI